MKYAIINGKIFTGNEILTNKIILVENSKVTGLLNHAPAGATLIDLEGQNISAGLIDIQINGGFQSYFSQSPDEQTLNDMAEACLQYGTLHFLPTLISSPLPTILKAVEAVKEFQLKYPQKGVLGMHLEGPFFNPAKRGAHNKDIIRKPTDAELELIVTHGKGTIKVMTIAPEIFSDQQLLYLKAQNIILSAGHSNMTFDQAQHYFDLGIHLTTHLFNAMSPFSHRSPGMTGAILHNEQVYTSIILDGHHVDYAAAKIAYRLKTDKLILITDSTFLGREKSTFEWNGFDASMQNGTYRNKEGNLAGAAISMIEAVQNAQTHLHIRLNEAIEMATSRVANAINMEGQIGVIKEGASARFLVFDDQLKDYFTIIL